MRGLLLAGLRLASGSPVAAMRVGGLSLLERAAFVARDAGVTEAVVVAERPLHAALRAAVGRADLGVALTFADPLTERDAILLDVVQDEAVLVVRADIAHTHLVAPALRDAEPGELLVDEREAPIRGAESLRLTTGPTWVGVGVVRPDVLGDLLDGVAREPLHGDVAVLDTEVTEGRLQAVPVTGLPWQAVRSEAETHAAERLLIAAMAKPADGWVARHLLRPLSARLTALLAGSRVEPNHVTLAAFVVAMGGCIAITSSGRWYPVALLGALVLAGAAVLGEVDGELARLRHQCSPLGGWLDMIGRDLTSLATIMAVTAHVAGRGSSALWTGLGVGAAVGTVVAAALAYLHLITIGSASRDDYLAALEAPGAAATPGKRLWGMLARLKGREHEAVAVLACALVGQLWLATAALFVAAATSCAAAVRRRLRGLEPGA
jgi:phosphatidylglycerophosphate synthase